MIEHDIRQESLSFLNLLIDEPLSYGIKSPDMDLYDFGFGQLLRVPTKRDLDRKVGMFALHATCRFKIIRRIREHYVQCYYEDTPAEEFHRSIKPLVGLCVKRIGLSTKNDLWLDFGDYWMVFATFENDEESWRFFAFTDDKRHLVAADSWLTLD